MSSENYLRGIIGYMLDEYDEIREMLRKNVVKKKLKHEMAIKKYANSVNPEEIGEIRIALGRWVEACGIYDSIKMDGAGMYRRAIGRDAKPGEW